MAPLASQELPPGPPKNWPGSSMVVLGLIKPHAGTVFITEQFPAEVVVDYLQHIMLHEVMRDQLNDAASGLAKLKK